MPSISSILLAIGQNDPQAGKKAHIEVSLYIYHQLKSASFEYGLDNQTKIYSAETQKMLYLQFEKDYEELVKYQDDLLSHLNNISSFFQNLYLTRLENLGFASPIKPVKNEVPVIKQEIETLDSLEVKLKEINTDFRAKKEEDKLLGMEINDSKFALFSRFEEYNDIYFKFIDLLAAEEILKNQEERLSESLSLVNNNISEENNDKKIKKSYFMTEDLFPQDGHIFSAYRLLPSLIQRGRHETFLLEMIQKNKLNVDNKTRNHLLTALLTMDFIIDNNRPSAFQQRIIQKAHEILSLFAKSIPTEAEEKASLTHQNTGQTLEMLDSLLDNTQFFSYDSTWINLHNFNHSCETERKVTAENKQAFCQLWYQISKLIAINIDKLEIERLEFGFNNPSVLGITTIPELAASIICGIYHSGKIDRSVFLYSSTVFNNISRAFEKAAAFILSDEGLLLPHGKFSPRENMTVDILCESDPVFKLLPREDIIEMLNRYIRENNSQFTDNIDRLHTHAMGIYKRINFDFGRYPEESKHQGWNLFQALKKHLMFKTPNVLFDTLFFKEIGKLAASKTVLTYNAISNALKTTLQHSDVLEARMLKAITGHEDGQGGGIKINNALLLTLHAKRLAQNVAAVLVASYDEIDNERLVKLTRNIQQGLLAKLSESLKPRQYEPLFFPTYCSQGRAILDFNIALPKVDGTLTKIRLSQRDLQSWIKPAMECQSNTLLNSSPPTFLVASTPNTTVSNTDYNNTPPMR